LYENYKLKEWITFLNYNVYYVLAFLGIWQPYQLLFKTHIAASGSMDGLLTNY